VLIEDGEMGGTQPAGRAHGWDHERVTIELDVPEFGVDALAGLDAFIRGESHQPPWVAELMRGYWD
jgi:hypothetical protein